MNSPVSNRPPARNRFRWGALGLTLGAQVAVSVLVVGVSAVAPFVQAEWALSRSQVGLLVATANLGVLLSLPLVGWSVDRFGERLPIGYGGVLSGIAAVAAALAPGYASLAAILAVVGFGSAVHTPAGGRAIMGWFPAHERATAMSIRQTGIPLGGALAGAILPSIALVSDWRRALLLAGLGVVAVSVAFIYLYRPGPELPLPPRAPAAAGRPGAAAGRPGRWREVLTFDLLMVYAGGFFFPLGQYATITYLMLYLQEHWAIGVETGRFFFVLLLVSGGAGRILWGVVSDRAGGGRKRVLIGVIWLAAASIAALALLPVTAPRGLLALVTILCGASALGWNGVQVTLISELSPPGRQGTAVAASMVSLYITIFTAPPTFGYLVDRLNTYQPAWLAVAGLLVAGSLFIMPVREPGRHR